MTENEIRFNLHIDDDELFEAQLLPTDFDYPVEMLEELSVVKEYVEANAFWQRILEYFVPKTRKINNKDLSSDITLTAQDIGASKVEYVPSGNDQGKKIGKIIIDGVSNDLVAPDFEKLAHSITIGDKIFDGSKNVVVEVYDGTLIDEHLVVAPLSVQMESSTNNDTSLDSQQTMVLLKVNDDFNNMANTTNPAQLNMKINQAELVMK